MPAPLDLDIAVLAEKAIENLSIVSCTGNDVTRPFSFQTKFRNALQRFDAEEPAHGRVAACKMVLEIGPRYAVFLGRDGRID